nr:hypothetical protein GCM10020092_059740 [Actinoplanes digitatis]
MTRGRGAFMYTHNPAVIGFGGNAAYWDNISSQNAYAVTASPGTFTEQTAQRKQTPSHWRSVHTSGSVRLEVTKFITHNNVLVTNLAVVNTGTASATVQLSAVSPYATTGSGTELTGTRAVKNNLTTLYPRFSGDGFAAASGALTRSVTVAAGQTVTTKVQLGLVANEVPQSLTEYNAYRGYAPATAFATHVRDYNRWWAQNVPYIDVPDAAIKKNIYYRWWLMRFNYLDVDIPGQDFQFPQSVEGATGYNNAIALTQPMHIDDLKYLRSPEYSYGPYLAVGQSSAERPVHGQPGRPGELVKLLHPVHRRGGLARIPDPRRAAYHAAELRPVRRGRREGPARHVRHQQQRRHRVRLGRDDRQRRRRRLVPLAGQQPRPGGDRLRVVRRQRGPRRVLPDG